MNLSTPNPGRRGRPRWRGARLLALAGAGLLTGVLMDPAAAQNERDLIDLINRYRAAPQPCPGIRGAPARALMPSEALATVQLGPGAALQDALRARGYRAAQAQVIRVSGPTSASGAMELMTQRYCSVLADPGHVEIGVSRRGAAWTVVLAKPLLAPGLGDSAEAGREILRLTNAARAEPRRCGAEPFAAAPPLAWQEALAAAALVHSRDMAARDDFSHQGGDGSRVDQRVTRQRYPWKQVGENIAAGQGSPAEALAAWLTSPPHCSALMSPSFKEMGAAYALGADTEKLIFWTQVFGTPR
jgi:uncharacterized protein YkwD